MLLASVFMHAFSIAFGTPPAASLWVLGSFQNPSWRHFAYFFADASKLKKYNSEMLGFGGVGPSFLHDFLLTF